MTSKLTKARLALAERVLGEMYGGTMSSEEAKAQGKEMNRKAKVRRNLSNITKRATAQAQKTIQGTDTDEPTLSGGSRPWNKSLT